jgi:hypothetical protein
VGDSQTAQTFPALWLFSLLIQLILHLNNAKQYKINNPSIQICMKRSRCGLFLSIALVVISCRKSDSAVLLVHNALVLTSTLFIGGAWIYAEDWKQFLTLAWFIGTSNLLRFSCLFAIFLFFTLRETFFWQKTHALAEKCSKLVILALLSLRALPHLGTLGIDVFQDFFCFLFSPFGGTPGYVPPEVLQNTRSISAAADVYALGVLLAELFSLRRAPKGQDPRFLVNKIVAEAEDPEAVKGAARIMVKMLDIKVENRPSPDELVAAFGELIEK